MSEPALLSAGLPPRYRRLGDEIILTKETADKYKEFVCEKKETVTKRLHETLLAEALRELSSVKAVKLSDSGNSYFNKLFYGYARERVGRETTAVVPNVVALRCDGLGYVDITGYCARDHPLTTLAQALHDPGRRIEELELHFANLDEDVFDMPTSRYQQLTASLQNVRKLSVELHLKDEAPRGIRSLPNSRDASPTSRNSRCVTWVTLGILAMFIYEIALRYTRHPFPQLRVRTLEMMELSAAQFMLVLDTDKDTLTTLKMRSVTLIGGDWSRTFRVLSMMQALKVVVHSRGTRNEVADYERVRNSSVNASQRRAAAKIQSKIMRQSEAWKRVQKQRELRRRSPCIRSRLQNEIS
ncbi:hypothetical protein K469DRAFT_707532 [Zopfia rhizophila CBS 207.26]|uniref:Uncharacterized protein n=1 Tax=Zopfia rhizophila CBS 207.26 TaxID=1314779 RepID=A0A6A6E3W2_9PEZI|nr:hypothetical protein K469DRAFT_707532 [Zopfia rhizophila CBS 207.26]